MSKVLVDEKYLKGIGNALRYKKNEPNTVEYHTNVMEAEIRNLKVESPADSDIEDYVWNEAFKVSEMVKSVRKSNSLVLGCFSDIHFSGIVNSSSTNPQLQHTGQALDLIRKMIGIDAVVMLGDMIDGFSGSGTGYDKSTADKQIAFVNSYFKEIYDKTLQFRLNGNHDILTKATNGEYFSSEELYNRIGKYNTTDCTYANPTEKYKNYGYHDFEDQKIRLIYLNTCDSDGVKLRSDGSTYTNCRISTSQLQWLVEALDLTDKSEVALWSIITIGHHPLEFGKNNFWNYTDSDSNEWGLNCYDAVKIIDAYNNGAAGSIIHYSGKYDEGTITYNFTEKNQAKYIGHFHGHVHNFYTGEFGSTTIKPKDVAIPNIAGGDNRNNGAYSAFHEDLTYSKVSGTEKDTAFCIIVLNPEEEKIYCYNYGAGYDRILYYGINPVDVASMEFENNVYYTTVGESLSVKVNIIPENATNKYISFSSSDDSISTVTTGRIQNEAIIAPIKSGEVTITATAHNGITASFTLIVKAKKIKNVFNNDGQAKDGYRLSKNTGLEKEATGFAVSGYIPIDGNIKNLVYLKGSSSVYNPNTNPNFIIAVYDTNKNFIASSYIGKSLRIPLTSANTREDSVTVLTMGSNSNWSYIRLCCLGTVDQLILTLNADPNDESNTISLDSVISDVQEYARLESAVENIAETYLDYEDDPEVEINPEWEAQIGTINGFFSDLKQNLEETYIGGEQNAINT